MKQIPRSPVSARVQWPLLALAAMLSLLLLLCVSALVQIGRVSESLTIAMEGNATTQREAATCRDSVQERATALRDLVLEDSAAAIDQQRNIIARAGDAYAQCGAALAALARSGQLHDHELDALQSIAEFETRANELTENVIQLKLGARTEPAHRLLLDKAGPAYNGWGDRISALINFEDVMTRVRTTTLRTRLQQTISVICLLVGLMLLLAASACWFVTCRLKSGTEGAAARHHSFSRETAIDQHTSHIHTLSVKKEVTMQINSAVALRSASP